MNWDLFVAFLLITLVLMLTPGPIVTLTPALLLPPCAFGTYQLKSSREGRTMRMRTSRFASGLRGSTLRPNDA